MSTPPLEIVEPHDGTRDQVESRSELDEHLRDGSVAGLTIQGLRLDRDPPDLSQVAVTGALFVGCRFASSQVAADLVGRGAHVVPAFDVPYPTAPGRLYIPSDLADGFTDGGFAATYDTRVYEHYKAHGGATPDVREALAQRLHDYGIEDALVELTTGWRTEHGAASVVGVMGGHEQPRGSVAYREAAELGWRLARAGLLVVTGGGPGIMEAANLGGYLAGHDQSAVVDAIDQLSQASDVSDRARYTAAALAVRARLHPPGADPEHPVPDLRLGGLSIPTWLYGHEPTNLFGARIAKYFSNAIREDTILRLARGGVVFAAGQAGTVQEVFQAATKTFYASDGTSGPYVFLGRRFWTADLPVSALLQPLLRRTADGADLTRLIHFVDRADEAAALLTGG